MYISRWAKHLLFGEEHRMLVVNALNSALSNKMPRYVVPA
jgi:hypothetical protein